MSFFFPLWKESLELATCFHLNKASIIVHYKNQKNQKTQQMYINAGPVAPYLSQKIQQRNITDGSQHTSDLFTTWPVSTDESWMGSTTDTYHTEQLSFFIPTIRTLDLQSNRATNSKVILICLSFLFFGSLVISFSMLGLIYG